MNTSKTSAVSFQSKCSILAEFSLKYKDDSRFAKLIRDNDLGFPYAFGVASGHFEPSSVVALYIEDTWNMLLLELLPQPEFGFVEEPQVSTLDQLVELAGLD